MKKSFILSVLIVGFFSRIVFASSTDGIIDQIQHYAWSKDFGWLNFAAVQGNIHVTDSGLAGYIWNPNTGWINLAPTNSGQQVTNDGEGNLSGYAWGEASGWFGFSGVTIDANGLFHGISTGQNGKSFTFYCDNCSVKTDWRAASTRGVSSPPPPPPPSNGGGGSNSGGGGAFTFPTPTFTAIPTSTPIPTPTPSVLIPSFPTTGSDQSLVSVVWSILNIRTLPSLTGSIIGRVSVKTQGTIIGGPISKDGYTWLQVNYQNGLSGWSAASGLLRTNFIPPTPRVPALPVTGVIPASGLVSVQWPHLNVRSLPSLNSSVVGQVLAKTQGTILNGPTQKDGYAWLRVGYQNGLTGWSVSAGLRTKASKIR